MSPAAPPAGTSPPPLRVRLYAWAAGAVCHVSFAAAVAAMIWVMAHGMTAGLGRLAAPWGAVADALLVAQFVLAHSALLGRRGGGWLKALAPRSLGATLSTTTYVTVVSLQTLALFALWTPSGIVWWRATGGLRLAILAADAAAWMLLLKAIADAGLSLQTGALGWRAAASGRPPAYPPMPTRGLFAHIRQPIYLAFALTTWATPVWTPDQLAVALTLSAYCLLGPRLKEARFQARYGDRFAAYRARTPYWIPRRPRSRSPTTSLLE